MPFEPFHYEMQQTADAAGWPMSTVYCHGRIIAENTAELRALIQPLIDRGGSVVLDFTDLKFLDSSGLGTIVSFKVSALNRGNCRFELVNLMPRIEKMLLLTNLLELFAGNIPTHLV